MSIRKTIFDTIAVSTVNIFRLLAQFIAVPILSRLLSPSDYGLVAMAMPFLLFAMVIADAGIGVSLVRTPLTERREWSTCFWLSVMLGAALAAIMMALAPLFAMMFDEPRLTPIVMALALVVFIQSVCAIQGAAMQQQQQFRLSAASETVAVAVSIITAVVVAKLGGGAWALVFQQLSSYMVRVVLTLWFSPFRPQMVFDLSSVRGHIAFGKDVLGVNILGFIGRSIDNLVIGKVLSAAAVGVYSMAFQFARLPSMLVSGPLQYVFYAKLARVKENNKAIRHTFLLLTRVLAIVVFPAMGLVGVAYHSVFTVMLSAKWAPAGRIFMLVAAICALQAVAALWGTIRMLLGRTDWQLRVTVESSILWLVTLFATVRFGLDWLAIAYSIVNLLYMPRGLMLVLPLINCSYSEYIRVLLGPAFATCCCIVAFLSLQHMFQWSDVAQLGFALLLATIGMAAGASLQWRSLAEEFMVLKTV